MRYIWAPAAVAALLAGPAVAGGASYSIRPAHFDPGDPATRAYFKRTVAPGASFADGVIVSNGGSVPVELLVYPVDGLTGQTSGAVYANQGVSHRAGRWVRVRLSRLTLAPGAHVTVGFTVRVPRAAKPGDHLAGIAFQNAHAAVSGGSFRIREVLREVVGVLVRVPGPATALPRLGRLGIATLPGTGLAAVMVGIRNAGRLLCKPSLRVSLAGGSVRESISRNLDTILPGDAIRYPLVLQRGLKPASYRIAARAACPPATSRTTAVVRLASSVRGVKDAQAAAAPATAAVRPRARTNLWLFAGIAGLAALAGLVAGLLLRFRRTA